MCNLSHIKVQAHQVQENPTGEVKTARIQENGAKGWVSAGISVTVLALYCTQYVLGASPFMYLFERVQGGERRSIRPHLSQGKPPIY
jgi:hypothetical protein